MEDLCFVIDQRSVRERYVKLERNVKRKIAAEARASGTSPEKTEIDDAIETIMEWREEAEEERETAESVQNRSTERLAETKAREN